ncbi:GrpB-like predicted nucleotidyltransferase (UPF0157 family) [Haloactinospora alba]|uniref:GrpB-like predicted nucleotidyltransferase (UPF0157 family) n=1 Tax=Haloactinospora alba TaxID=405555 RepID=A0A543N724_9ACTN|nr:GrpB family protein [Haloactinospora alba]TQN27631.1 GrpB-like predicted nucleotidyltransferase (UPF0157 family) [Haloactinospora alba]
MPSSDRTQPLPMRGDDTAAVRDSPALADGRVQLSDYDPKWPYLFGREADRVRGALRARALRIEHVGSTAVPGLSAHPCVDILLLVADATDEDRYRPALEHAGYTLLAREPQRGGRRTFRGPDVNATLYVLTEGAPEAERMLLFRDRLRTDENERAVYDRAKQDLARYDWHSAREYAEAKSDVVEAILARAPDT